MRHLQRCGLVQLEGGSSKQCFQRTNLRQDHVRAVQCLQLYPLSDRLR